MRIQDGGHQENDKRAGTENVPLIVGMAKALEISDREIISYNNHLRILRDSCLLY